MYIYYKIKRIGKRTTIASGYMGGPGFKDHTADLDYQYNCMVEDDPSGEYWRISKESYTQHQNLYNGLEEL